MRRRAVTGAVAVALLAACSGTSPSGSDASALRTRPMMLLTLTEGQPCPVTTIVSRPTADLGEMVGDAPARPVFGSGATMGFAPPQNYGSDRWGGNKVVWAVAPDVRTDVLVRGHQLDGDSDVRFTYGDLPNSAEPLTDLVLSAQSTSRLPGGWRDFPTATRMRRPGCYAFQIDSEKHTDVIVVLVA